MSLKNILTVVVFEQLYFKNIIPFDFAGVGGLEDLSVQKSFHADKPSRFFFIRKVIHDRELIRHELVFLLGDAAVFYFSTF